MTDYLESNRILWNTWTQHDLESDHHQNVAGFRAGGLTLRSIEREALGDVRGRSLLHLQCNMGSDTLSWARLGARVTGVDISDAAIAQARALAAETSLSARFLRSDLYALPDVLDEQFDIVFASYGALCWLPDLTRWAEIVARYLCPGGTFLLVEMHPYAMMLETTSEDGLNFRVNSPYFQTAEPQVEAVRGQPVGVAASVPQSVYIWHYSLGEVVTALIQAGLCVQHLREFPLAHYQQFPCLVRGDDGWWRWPSADNTLPMLFSVAATKPQAAPQGQTAC
ncbi:MAG TPA: class I SAM-dependent methyltransferase [Ktedonobacterales bacterium]|nr:class I SAM-dependent methyltransferase [Ktedonobacterales bacterium]